MFEEGIIISMQSYGVNPSTFAEIVKDQVIEGLPLLDLLVVEASTTEDN